MVVFDSVGYEPPEGLRGTTVFMVVIYRNPSDYPGQVVMRTQCPLLQQYKGHDVAFARYCGVYGSVEEARDDLPPGAFHLGRQTADDPSIEEVWML